VNTKKSNSEQHRLNFPALVCFLWVFLCATVMASGRAESVVDTARAELSYGMLAEAMILPEFQSVVDDLTTIRPDTLPHETKQVRKDMAKLRELIDVFAFAFPADSWRDVRKSLDEGYEVVGHFKDLFDSQGLTIAPEDLARSDLSPTQVRASELRYDTKELESRRETMLNWLSDFLDRDFQARAQALFRAAQSDALFPHARKDLSRFSWGGVETRPSEGDRGFDALRALMSAQAHEALKERNELVAIENPAKSHKDELRFHDYRKRLRALARLSEMFPGLVTHPRTLKDIAEVRATVDVFGGIGDAIVALQLAKEAGKNKKTLMLEKEIKNAWHDLRAHVEKKSFEKKLARVRNDLAVDTKAR
jgi:cytochrome c556